MPKQSRSNPSTRSRSAGSRSRSGKPAARAKGAGSARKAPGRSSAARKASSSSGGKLRFAVVGLGHIAQVAVLPAFAHARRHCELAALVSDDATKLRTLSKRYSVARTCSYDEYDELLASGDVDAVYIALPNTLHRDYTVRAAQAGVHVLCEKPLATTAEDCRAMIAACRQHRVRLMVAYRLHFEAATLAAVELVRKGKLGEPRIFNSVFTMQVKDPDNIRLQRKAGGGVLYDIGIYCINAARSLFREEPLEVSARSATGDDPRFSQVEEMFACTLHYPGEKLATFTASFGAADVSQYRVVGTRGDVSVEPAFEYAEGLKLRQTIGGKTREREFAKRDQFAPELIYFAKCVRDGVDPEPSGVEGLADVRIIEALHRSAESWERVALDLLPDAKHPSPRQEIRRPAVSKPTSVHARSPSGD